MRIIDNAFSAYRQGYELARIVRTDSGHTVRARVRRDSYSDQSHAVAEVLAADLTWTQLVSTGADSWHKATPYITNHDRTDSPERKQAEKVTDRLATDLLKRAAAVLSA